MFSSSDKIAPFVREEFGIESELCLRMLENGRDEYIRCIGRILAKYDEKAVNEQIYSSYDLDWFDNVGRVFEELDREVGEFIL